MGRNFSPARNVLSITAPSVVRLSLVRTNGPPLPGLTCWNSTILKTVPSTSMWVPFLNWFVLITAARLAAGGRRAWVARGRSARPRAAATGAGQHHVRLARLGPEAAQRVRVLGG